MANQQRRSQPRAAGEARAVGGRPDGPDVNKDRLIFCITSLIGQKVTASLRNNVQYEGMFHSCALDGDYSITLKSARRLFSDTQSRSAEVVPTLLIPGKDFLQVSAMNVPPPSPAEEGRKGFATDAEISRREGESQRELVPWQGDGYAPGSAGGLEESAHDGKWDQFAVNKEMYGVSTTWHEDIYTTKLDKSQVPQDKRDKADQIAREIESGNMHAEVEDNVDRDVDGDEEARFSAAQPMGGNSKALQKPLPQVPERPGQDIAGGQDRGGRKGMISEMKRINALNLEPTSAKHDETTARSRMNMKEAARGNAQRMQGTLQDLKSEFQQSLEIIAQQDAKKRGKNPDGNSQWDGQNTQNQKGQSGGAMAKAGDQSRQQSDSFSFNPQAKSFTLNPAAVDFTPGGGQAQTPAKSSAPSPSFSTYSKKPPGKSFKGGLSEILEMFFQRAKNSTPDSAAPDWPDAKGPSYKDVLGQPNPSGQRAVAGAGQMHMQNMAAQAGSWQTQNQGQQGGQQATNQAHQVQQQQQVPQQNAPQNQDQQQGGPNVGGQGGMPMQPTMMPQGFVVAGAPGPGQGNQPNQMQQYGNMYPGQQGQPHQGQGMGQPTIVFNQAPVMGQGSNQMMPTMIAQGQQGQMGVTAPMAKFPGQQQQMLVVPMMLAGPNQYGNGQGFGMQGPMQGQGTMPPQGGGPQGDGGQGQMMQQNMYPRQQ